MSTKIRDIKRWIASLKEWVDGIEPIKAIVALFIIGPIGIGMGWAQLNGRIENNAAATKQETTDRSDGDKAISARLDRGFDKVLSRLDGLDQKITTNANRASDDRAETKEKLGYIQGLLKQNFGDIPVGERNGR